MLTSVQTYFQQGSRVAGRHACMHAHTHMHIYIPTYLHTYKHTYILAGMSRWGSSCRLPTIVAMANMTVMATVTIFSWNEVGILKRDHLVDQPCRGRFAFWQTRYNEVGFAQETARLLQITYHQTSNVAHMASGRSSAQVRLPRRTRSLW